MTEGSFPKSDGDKLYASEVNLIRTTNNYLPSNQFHESPNVSRWGGFGLNARFTEDILKTSSNFTFLNASPLTREYLYYTEYYNDTNAEYTAETYELESPDTINKAYVFWDYGIFDVYDECDDSSINASLWDNSSATEDTEKITCVSDGSSWTSKDLSSYKAFKMGFRVSSYGADESVPGRESILRLTDGTNQETILEKDVGIAHRAGAVGEAFFFIDSTNDVVTVGLDYVDYYDTRRQSILETQTIDTSGWSSIKLGGVTDSLYGGQVACYNLRECNLNPSTTVTISLTADGTNWETTQNGAIHSFSDSGTALASKLTGTVGSSEVMSLKGLTLIPIG